MKLSNGKETLVKVKILKTPLLSDKYYISISLSVGFDSVDRWEHCLSFNIEPGDYYGTGKINDSRSGKLLLNYNFLLKNRLIKTNLIPIYIQIDCIQYVSHENI